MVTRKEAENKARLIKRKMTSEPSESDIEEAKSTFRRIEPSLNEAEAKDLKMAIEKAESK